MSIIITVALFAIGFALTYSAIRLPSWFFAAIHKNVFWEIRDNYVDQIIAGQLDKSNQAVRTLKQLFEQAVRQDNTLLSFTWYNRQTLSETKQQRCFTQGLVSLPAKQQQIVKDSLQQLTVYQAAQIMLSSWYGLGMTWVFMFKVDNPLSLAGVQQAAYLALQAKYKNAPVLIKKFIFHKAFA